MLKVMSKLLVVVPKEGRGKGCVSAPIPISSPWAAYLGRHRQNCWRYTICFCHPVPRVLGGVASAAGGDKVLCNDDQKAARLPYVITNFGP